MTPTRDTASKQAEVVIITGLSGSGKSTIAEAVEQIVPFLIGARPASAPG